MNGKKMKVLMTTDTASEVWKYSLDLCKTLEQFNLQIHLVALGGWPSPYQQIEAEKAPNVILYKSDLKFNWMIESWEDFNQSRKWLNSIYHTINPDILHLNNYSHVEESWTSPLITAFHSGGQIWWHASKGEKEPLLWNKYLQVIKPKLDTGISKKKQVQGELPSFQHRRRNIISRQAV